MARNKRENALKNGKTGAKLKLDRKVFVLEKSKLNEPCFSGH